MPGSQKYLIAIGGPTATGKTKTAIELAVRLGCEIINADSRQFYRGLDIGTAKPSPDDLGRVPHHLIDFLDPSDGYTAGQFEKDTEKILCELFSTSDYCVVVGGTGLYLKAITEGLDPLPPSSAESRAFYENILLNKGIGTLQGDLRLADPDYFEKIDQNNPHRLIRALCIYRDTGQRISSLQQQKRNQKEYATIKIYLTDDRAALYERINRRVDAMMGKGLLEEYQRNLKYRHCQAFQTIGYKEFIDYTEGNCSLEEAVDKIKQHSRNYAKRQLTWFKNQKSWSPFPPESSDDILEYIQSYRVSN